MEAESLGNLALYEHVKRPQWGLAIHVADEGNKQHFQFQDGQMRAFHERFARLLQVVDRDDDEANRIKADLVGRAQISVARAERAAAGKAPSNLMSFNDQRKVFRHLYPGGFQDETYSKKVRGDDDSVTRRKGHRQPIIEMAQDKLGPGVLAALVADGEFEAVRDAFLEIGKSTDLVSAAKDLAPIADLPEARCEAFAKALLQLLDGDKGDVGKAMDAFIASIKTPGVKGPSWAAVTAIPAVCRPNQLVPVRPTTFRSQAQWFAPDLTMSNTPSGVLYARLLDMGKQVKRRLAQAGLEARDLVDVYDFIWLTLRPKARALLAEL